MNFRNLYCRQSVVEQQPNLVFKFAYFRDLDDVNLFNISVVNGGKEGEEVKVAVDATVVIIYKNPFMVNGQPVIVSLALGEGVACNTIFSWPFLQTIKVSILTDNNTLVIGILGEKFNLEMLVPQTSREEPKTS